jgi:hypothetical protein
MPQHNKRLQNHTRSNKFSYEKYQTMNTPRTYDILSAKASLLSSLGLRLKLWQDGELWRWQWNNGLAGCTDAQNKAVALVFALENI